jgi:hypothetical protein
MPQPTWLIELKKRNAAWAALSDGQRQARMDADVRAMEDRASHLEDLMRLNAVYLRQRERQTSAPLTPRRPSCAARPRERRDGSRRRTVRAGPSADDGPSPPAARLCACGCGRDLAGRRSDCSAFDASCRSRLARDGGRPPVSLKTCACGPLALATADPDGDLICAKCGRLLGHVATRINGYDALDRLMQTDSDGQPYRLTRPRSLRAWRDWQPNVKTSEAA